ncbi:hypothetical protein EVAR_15907_1 [Eumeta japonica]|uniref:Uncharacterized protein n=1 Tax=Eumeta variegata TaxID=151549 RepID=A0A4C1UEZ8_EUMVA|nr:hypothetical protein EVAR_15907_1 [Eumeta japonica]
MLIHIEKNGQETQGLISFTDQYKTEWRDGEAIWYSTLRLDPFCTVFQAEMFALQRTLRRARNGKDGLVYIFRDSRSSLEVLTGSKTYHSLVHEARRNISEIVAEDRAVRLFWVRADVKIAGNDCADELNRRATITKSMAADYDRFPLSHEKKVKISIRAVSLEEWQQRYTEESSSEITKCFFPQVEKAYRVLRKIEMMSQVMQTLTGYGGFARYLYRFKLRTHSTAPVTSPKAGIDVWIAWRNFPEILEDSFNRGKILYFCGMIVKRCNRINQKIRRYLIDVNCISVWHIN